MLKLLIHSQHEEMPNESHEFQIYSSLSFIVEKSPELLLSVKVYDSHQYSHSFLCLVAYWHEDPKQSSGGGKRTGPKVYLRGGFGMLQTTEPLKTASMW